MSNVADPSTGIKIYNRIEGNYHLSNKKAMFYNMKSYYEAIGEDVFTVLPLTFHVHGQDDPEFLRFREYFDKKE
jgi:tubulin--tyrosine ligase